ncbi:hypothetical protein EC968_010182 [Mortierella alpina]|nr:hypothetical protein EC968_010182 [Mortierella alpina]
MGHDKHAMDPQALSSDPDDDEDYLAIYQDERMNAPQEYGYSTSDHDQTRLNNPQDHGDQVDHDDETLFQEIQRIQALQEEHLLQQLNLERVCLEKGEKLHNFAGRKRAPPATRTLLQA